MNKPCPDRNLGNLPRATIEKSRLSWALWLVPAGALILCGWFAYRDVIETGPTITIYFNNVDGLQEKNTEVKFLGVHIGQLKAIDLTPDHQKARITVQLTHSAASIARSGSLFWVVRPELKIGNISGLNTIVSGDYISVQPGQGAATNSFIGAEKEPLTEEPKSLEIILRSPDLGSLQEMSPIFYRGIEVGEILYFQLGENSSDVVMHARVKEQYAPLVRTDTKFWNAGGVDIHVGLFKGLRMSAESPRTLISGGIEFATPTELQPVATNGTTFQLYDKAEDKWKTWMPSIKLNLPLEASQPGNGTPTSAIKSSLEKSMPQ